ncbi:MAG TPA: hypothetical protein VMV92_01765 [Streptosporangiaceae bacterium]|nr:hypothetical protein [Streptosporangiaceae bacterium]
MNQPRWTTGRVQLAVTPGPRAVVAVHDPGIPPDERRQWLSHAQESWGAWVYAQRGHAPSGWAAGRVYRASDFAIDLVRLLRNVLGQPCLLVAAGAGGLVAVLAAAAAPDVVTGLHLLGGDNSSGWGADPTRVMSEDGVLNRSWLDAVESASAAASCDGDDPLLRYGPAEKMHQPAVCAAAAQLRAPWSVRGGHFLEPCLPARMRAAVDLVPIR